VACNPLSKTSNIIRSTVYSFLSAVCILTFCACDNQSQPLNQSGNFLRKDSVEPRLFLNAEPPGTKFITDANKPRKFRAGRPAITKDPSGGGAPSFSNFDTEQGLALGSVSSCVVDQSGNLWFGTFGGGVSRFDGKSFTNFTAENGLAGNGVWCLTKDHAGNLWFGTNGSGLSKFDGKRFITYTMADGLSDNVITSIIADRNGKLWIGTKSRGVCTYDGNSFKNLSGVPEFLKGQVKSIFQDRAQNIWFGGIGNSVARFDGKTFIVYKLTNANVANINCFAQDKSNRMWIGTTAGLFEQDGDAFSKFQFLRDSLNFDISSIVQDSKGILWFATHGNGVLRYDGKEYVNYGKLEGLQSTNLTCAMVDNSGLLWFGTGAAGVIRYNGNAVTSLSSLQGLHETNTWNIFKDRSGSLWFASMGKGITKYDGSNFINYGTDDGLVGRTVHCINQDKNGNLWIGTETGASSFDGVNFTNYTTVQGLPDNDIWSMTIDRQNNIWFGTNGAGAAKFDGKSFTSYKIEQGLPSNNIYRIIETTGGDIWFGTHGGGASRFDGKRFFNYTTAEGLSGNSIYSIIEDKIGKIWFGTDGNGASVFDGKSFTSITTADGLPDNVVYAIAEDPKNKIIWLGTNLGLSALRIGNKEQYAFENFNYKTGYPIKDLNVNALYVDDGIVWGGCGDNKVIKLDYDAVKKSSVPFNLFLTNIQVDGEPICWNSLMTYSQNKSEPDSLAMLNEMIVTFGKPLNRILLDSMQRKFSGIRFDSISRFYPIPQRLVLPYENNNVAVDFAAVGSSLPQQVTYRYKLENYDEEWSAPNKETSAVFRHLHEGKYVFRLKAVDPSGATSEKEYRFQILPPWYRTWWAYSIYSLAFLALVFFLNRLLRSRILRKEREKAREIELHHAKEIEKAYHELKTTQAHLIQAEKMAYLGQLTAGIAHEIQNPLNFMNNFAEVNTEMIEEMQQEAANGNINDVISLASSIKQNEEKIARHGKRLDSIVKTMMQHASPGAGNKEPTDINALADEYLRLNYRTYLTKTSAVQIQIVTDFDDRNKKKNLIPQDIGRVLSNLYSNAFYSLSEKAKKNIAGYVPTLWVSTKFLANAKTEITVRDNGMGIPQNIIDKIFQPFFTTKPSGSGTGLGLSLSFDIIKLHGGILEVTSNQGEYAQFVVVI